MWVKDKANQAWEGTKGFAYRHPALIGAVAGGLVGSGVPVVGTLAGVVSGAAAGYYIGRDRELPKEDKNDTRTSAS